MATNMAKTAQAVLGIDVGTTAVKAVVVGADGEVLGEGEVEQAIAAPRPGWAEQDPQEWWVNAGLASRRAMAAADGEGKRVGVAAVGLTGQMHSSVFLDGAGEVIRPALLWNDARTAEQRRHITRTLGMDGLRDMLGNLPLEGFTAPKVVWLMQNEPANYARLRTLLLPKDYIRYRLTGDYATDPSDAAGTLLYDVRRRRWSKAALDALGLDASVLPRVAGSTQITGEVSAEGAAMLGIAAGTPVVGGGADNAAGAVGCGAVSEGVMQASIGTSGTLLLPTREPRVAPDMNLHTFCHAVPDMWYLMGTVLSAGGALGWLRDVVAPGASYEALTAEAAATAAGSEGLLFLPYLSGERTPHNDANARGVFFGLSLAHRRAHLVRAVIEGACFALRDSLELMREQGASPAEARAIGGGARSGFWMQTLADVFNMPIAAAQPAAGAAYGAALLAMVGCGMFGDVESAVRACVRTSVVAEPNPARAAEYDEIYDGYRRLYPALRERFAAHAGIGAGARRRA